MHCHLLPVILFLALIFRQLTCNEFNETLLTSGNLTNKQMREVCGITKFATPQIVEYYAKPDLWPWMALIYRYNESRCGGSLINYRFILTAAHCLVFEHNHTEMIDAKAYSAKLAILDHNKLDGVQTYGAKKIIVHDDYVPRYFYNDIALLELEKNVTFSKSIIPICLPNAFELKISNYARMTFTAIGWGLITQDGNVSSKLQQIPVEVMTKENCEEEFPDMSDTEICAKNEKIPKAMCRSESGGGPLIKEDNNNQENIVGVTSKGLCDRYLNIFTRVSLFLPWIKCRAGM